MSISARQGFLASLLAVGLVVGAGALLVGAKAASTFESGTGYDQMEGLGPARSTPLEAAAGRGDLERVDALLRSGADPNDGTYASPLMAAVDDHMDKSMDIIRLLVDRGADVEFGGMRGSDQTPLHRAAMNDLPEVVELLLEQGADPCRRVSSPDSLSGMTALDIARSRSSVQAERVLENASSVCDQP